MKYPFKYPNLYGELAKQGKTKRELAEALRIGTASLRYKQSTETAGDFRGEEMMAASNYLNKPIDYLFDAEDRLPQAPLESADPHKIPHTA